MNVLWQDHDKEAWDSDHASAQAALQQDWAYGEAMAALGSHCLRCRVFDAGEPVAMAQFMVRRFAGWASVALCTRGPVWLRPLDAQAKYAAQRLMQRSLPFGWPRLVLFSPDALDAQSAGVARMHRVMTGYATVLLPLPPALALPAMRAAMPPKWRNRLGVAEASSLRVVRNGVKPAQYQWLIERERAQRHSRAYMALPLAFVPAYQQACGSGAETVLLLRADLGRDPVAAMLWLRHGSVATYHIGWSDPGARLPGAHNLLLWQAITAFKAAGVTQLDLGGINTARSAGVARFKIGSGGEVRVLAGTFL